MAEKWGNGHYTCYGCSEQDKPKNERYRCSNCFTYTPLMQGYYKNWTKEEKKQTNADRIRSMTDEELAEFIFSQIQSKCNNHDCVGADTCYYHADWNSGECDGCDKAILRWLQKECEV